MNEINVLAFGTYNTRKHPRCAILINGLRRNGYAITEINYPLELSTAARVDILNKPWKLFGFAKTLFSLWRKLWIDTKNWVSQNGDPDVVLVGYLGHFDVFLARVIFPHTPIILDHLIFASDTAKDRGAKGIKIWLLKLLDLLDFKASTLIITDTEEHQAMLPSGTRSIVIPVGASQAWFEAGQQTQKHSMDIVFYGLYTPLQGTVVIADAIRLLAKRGINPHVTMIGRGQDYTEVRRRLTGLTNVNFIDWIEPEYLPYFVAKYGIALGIFSNTPKGLRVVPNKVYQSMAAGCAVITSGTEPQKRTLGNGAVFTHPGDANSLAKTIESLIIHPEQLKDAQKNAQTTAAKFHANQITKNLSYQIINITKEK